jgi:hypothetical protein
MADLSLLNDGNGRSPERPQWAERHCTLWCLGKELLMLNEVVLTQSTFADLDTVGFGVAYIADPETVPRVGLATVDFSTDAEDRVELRPGESFQIAGEVWQLAEVRDATQPDWAVLLRRISDQN